MSEGRRIRMTFWGFTDEEQRALTDDITYVLIEHGVQVAGMQEWEEEL